MTTATSSDSRLRTPNSRRLFGYSGPRNSTAFGIGVLMQGSSNDWLKLARRSTGDHPLLGIGAVLRNVVTLRSKTRKGPPSDAAVLLEEFSEYVRARFGHLRVRTKPIERRNQEASFALSWFEDHFHPITLRPIDSSRQILILHRGNLGLSELLDDRLRSTERFKDVRWTLRKPGMGPANGNLVLGEFVRSMAYAAPLHSCKYRWLRAPATTLVRGPRRSAFGAKAGRDCGSLRCARSRLVS